MCVCVLRRGGKVGPELTLAHGGLSRDGTENRKERASLDLIDSSPGNVGIMMGGGGLEEEMEMLLVTAEKWII